MEKIVVEVDPTKPRAFRTVCFFGTALIRADKSTFDQAQHFVSQNCFKCALYVRVNDLGLDDIISLLNAGASKVFLSRQQFEGITSAGVREDLDRLVVRIPNPIQPEHDPDISRDEAIRAVEQMNKDRDVIRDLSPDVGVHYDSVAQSVLNALPTSSTGYGQAPTGRTYATCVENTVYAATCAQKKDLIPIVDESLFVQDDERGFKSPVETLITNSFQTDRNDGLFPTIVVDERGVCLGLVYSNNESVRESLKRGRGTYWSRKRGLWPKGETSGDIQELTHIDTDCDNDTLQFVVRQLGSGFCHLKTATCFGPYTGLSKLHKTLQARKKSAPPASYTSRLYSDATLLNAKIMEEASELCEAQSAEDIVAEAADLLYFALTKCVANGVTLEMVEANLDRKSLKVSRRKGDAKPPWLSKAESKTTKKDSVNETPVDDARAGDETIKEASSVPKSPTDPAGIITGRIRMKRFVASPDKDQQIKQALQRPSQRSTDEIMGIVKPIIERVRTGGDAAVLEYTRRFEKATGLKSPVLHAPFPAELMQLPQATADAIDLTFENIRCFHAAQKEAGPLQVETMPGVQCARFARPIERVGLYVPGGTAILPSTALMLGVPALVAECQTIVMASPPRADGTLTPEVVYAAHKVGARSIVLAGGAQAVAALAYGTESIAKVDKILGPGNQFVTAAKILVSNDTTARVAIDMPAGPSEVLVVADRTATPAFVAADLLSQAEHGVDSQVVLLAVGLDEPQVLAIEDEVNRQALALPRVDIVRGAIGHSVTLVVPDVETAMQWSNWYAPEHLILQVQDADAVVSKVQNAGSVFVGPWSPESVGDYSAGVNHSLPTYGYARQYSGVNLGSFTKHITSSTLTREGLERVGPAVMRLAEVEELEAHRRAVSIRLKK